MESSKPSSVYARFSRGNMTAKEAGSAKQLSPRRAQRWTSKPREVWLREKAEEREAIRAYHDDAGHSWTETRRLFGLSEDTVKRRGYRARKERERK